MRKKVSYFAPEEALMDCDEGLHFQQRLAVSVRSDGTEKREYSIEDLKSVIQ